MLNFRGVDNATPKFGGRFPRQNGELLVASHLSFSGGIFGCILDVFLGWLVKKNSQGLDGWAIDWWLHFHYRTLSAENRNFGGWNHRWTDWISGWLRRKLAWCECSQSLQILESNHFMFDDGRSRYVFLWEWNMLQQGVMWHKWYYVIESGMKRKIRSAMTCFVWKDTIRKEMK